MRPIKSLVLVALAIVAVAVAGPAVASAEVDPHSPSILCLVTKCIKELEAVAKGGEVITETLSGKIITSANTEATVRNCESIEKTEEKDANLCKDVTLVLHGVKKDKIGCRSETAAGEKDPVEPVLSLVDLHLAAEETLPGKVLQPLGLGKVLGILKEQELRVSCGIVKILMKGVLGCSVPVGLKNIPTTEELEVTCKKTTKGDPEVGMCVVECEWLETEPFLINIGAGFEDAAKLFTLRGKANKDIFIDD